MRYVKLLIALLFTFVWVKCPFIGVRDSDGLRKDIIVWLMGQNKKGLIPVGVPMSGDYMLFRTSK